MHCFTVLYHESNVSHPSLSISPSVHFHPLIPIFLCLCSSVTAVRLPDGLSFVVYEFWDGEEEWKRWVLIVFGSNFILNPELYPSRASIKNFSFSEPRLQPLIQSNWQNEASVNTENSLKVIHSPCWSTLKALKVITERRHSYCLGYCLWVSTLGPLKVFWSWARRSFLSLF